MDRLKVSTSPVRLNQYRASAAVFNRKHGTAYDWRVTKQHRAGITATPNVVRGEDGQMFTASVDQWGDYLGDAHTLVPRGGCGSGIDHTGWFADSFQSDLIIGGVAKLHTSRGTLYIPVTHCTQWDGSIHYFADAEMVPRGSEEEDHEVARRDAAMTADQCAKREAEAAREHDAKYVAEQDIENAREEIHGLNAVALPLLLDLKGETLKPTICSAVRAQLAHLLEQRREQFAIIDARQSDYWTAVQS